MTVISNVIEHNIPTHLLSTSGPRDMSLSHTLLHRDAKVNVVARTLGIKLLSEGIQADTFLRNVLLLEEQKRHLDQSSTDRG